MGILPIESLPNHQIMLLTHDQPGRKLSEQHGGMGAEFILHPLIHTSPLKTSAQDVEKKKRSQKLRGVSRMICLPNCPNQDNFPFRDKSPYLLSR